MSNLGIFLHSAGQELQNDAPFMYFSRPGLVLCDSLVSEEARLREKDIATSGTSCAARGARCVLSNSAKVK